MFTYEVTIKDTHGAFQFTLRSKTGSVSIAELVKNMQRGTDLAIQSAHRISHPCEAIDDEDVIEAMKRR